MSKNILTAALALSLATGLAACGEGTTAVGDTAHVRVLLTDAPIQYIEAAMVDIGAVQLVPANGDGPVTLTEDGTDGPVNLLELQNATTDVLADLEIDAATYTQIRLIVESASVTLKAGYEFNDGTMEKDLLVPSGAQTGIKLNLSAGEGDQGEGVDITGDLDIVLDFDVSQSFVIQGSPETPAGIFGMLFKPTIRVVIDDASGTISGTVSTELEDTDVEDLLVTATPVDEEEVEEFQTQVVTAMTNADGEFTLQFVTPGSYVVTVGVPDGLATDPASIEVGVDPNEDVIDVDFEVVTGS
jgi:hypothetical protein